MMHADLAFVLCKMQAKMIRIKYSHSHSIKQFGYSFAFDAATVWNSFLVDFADPQPRPPQPGSLKRRLE